MSKIEDTEVNVSICRSFCGSCPTYPKIEEEILYCARGKSSKADGLERKGCNCPDCAIQEKYSCTGGYYCIEGACE